MELYSVFVMCIARCGQVELYSVTVVCIARCRQVELYSVQCYHCVHKKTTLPGVDRWSFTVLLLCVLPAVDKWSCTVCSAR